MARLPQPGGDAGNWGSILNDYLSQSHKPDGTIKDNAVATSALAPNSVTGVKLASSSVSTTIIADGAVTNTKLAVDAVSKPQLSSALRTEIDDKITQDVADTSYAPSGALVVATPAHYPSIDVTGVTSASAALNAIFAAAPEGSTVKLIGIYRLDAVVDIPPQKFLTIDASAATFLLSGSGTKMRCVGGFEAPFGVTTVATEQLVVENKTRTFTRITVDSTPPWKVGDIIKIIADDVIPAAHVTSTTAQPRVGEFAVVHTVIGTSVYLKSPLVETYSTTIRVARLEHGSVTIVDPTVDVTDASVAAKQSSNFFRMQSLTMPQIVRPVFRRLTGMGISAKSCYGYVVDGGVGLYAMDDTDNGNYGYFVHDSSCQSGRLLGGDYTGGRHVFTDGTADTIVGTNDFADYGATMNFKCIGTTGRATTAACFDTHHASIGAEFIDCSTYPVIEESGYLLRGRKHRIINPKQYGGTNLLLVLTQETGVWSQGESYGHELVNPWTDGAQRAVVVYVRTHANHPQSGVRQELPNVTVHGGTHYAAQRRALATNGWIELVGAGTTRLGPVANGAIIEAQNSIITARDETVDATAVTSVGAGTQRVIFANDSTASMHSRIEFGHLGVSGSAAYMSAAAVPIEALVNTERFDFDDVVFDTNWGVSTPVAVPDSSAIQNNVRWRYRNLHAAASATQRSSHTLAISDAQISGSHRNIARSIDDNLLLIVSISDGTARTLSQLWLGKFIGQRLTIFRSNAGAVITIAHGASGRTTLAGGTNKTLSSVGDSLSLAWTGSSWSQIVQ